MKLMRTFIALMLIVSAGQTYAISTSGNNTEDRHLSGFHAVDISGSFDVFIVQGTTESVRVEAPANIIHHIATEVKGGTLNIYNKDHFSWGNLFSGGHRKIVIYVSVKNINSIALTGSGDVYFKEGISADNLRLAVTGSGDMSGKLNAKTLETSITGSGDVKVSGHADNSKVSVTGSGNYSGRDVSTINTIVRIGGSGDASVNASGSLQANVTGSGDIRYIGNPKNISKSKSGSGDIGRG